jgi:hypothetical protein
MSLAGVLDVAVPLIKLRVPLEILVQQGSPHFILSIQRTKQ